MNLTKQKGVWVPTRNIIVPRYGLRWLGNRGAIGIGTALPGVLAGARRRTGGGYTLQQDLGASDNASANAGWDRTTDRWGTAMSFVVGGTGYDLARFELKLGRIGTGGSAVFTGYLLSGAGSAPSAFLKTSNNTIAITDIPSTPEYIPFDFNLGNRESLSATTKYWCCVISDSISTTDYISVRYDSVGTGGVYSSSLAYPTVPADGIDGSATGTIKTYSA